MILKDQDPAIFESYSSFSNDYLGSKYNHWDLTDFKDVNLVATTKTIPMFLSSLEGGKLLDKDKLLVCLLDYYKDLNIVFNRLLNNSQDLMFRRFAFKAVMFKYNLIFKAITNNWDEIFSDAAYTYVTETHLNFDESYGISYNAYFDTHFSQVLYLAYVRFEILINKDERAIFKDTYLEHNKSRSTEVYRFSWLSEEDINILSRDNSIHLYHEDSHLLQIYPSSFQSPLSKL